MTMRAEPFEKPSTVLWTVMSVMPYGWEIVDEDLVFRGEFGRHRTAIEESCRQLGFEVVAEPASRRVAGGGFDWLETTWPVRRKIRGWFKEMEVPS